MTDNNQTAENRWSSNGLTEKDLEGLTKEYALILQSNVFSLDDFVKGKDPKDVLLRMSFRTESGQYIQYKGPTAFKNIILLRDMMRYSVSDLQGKICELYLKDGDVKEVRVNVNLLP